VSEFGQLDGRLCKKCKKDSSADRYKANRASILKNNKLWKTENKAIYRSQQRDYRLKIARGRRAIVLEAYGGECVCCGEDEPLFLTLDHVDGKGCDHRRELGVTDMWLWAFHQGFPKILQLLCMNCNMGRHRNGGVCPHVAKTADGAENVA
jgi:hypothetical protein